jgi:hypothetical protein
MAPVGYSSLSGLFESAPRTAACTVATTLQAAVRENPLARNCNPGVEAAPGLRRGAFRAFRAFRDRRTFLRILPRTLQTLDLPLRTFQLRIHTMSPWETARQPVKSLSLSNASAFRICSRIAPSVGGWILSRITPGVPEGGQSGTGRAGQTDISQIPWPMLATSAISFFRRPGNPFFNLRPKWASSPATNFSGPSGRPP